MSHHLDRQILPTPTALSEASELQMIDSVSTLWKSLRENGREAMGEACLHHHGLLANVDGWWPHIDESAPVYWSVLDCENEHHASAALEWAGANRADHNFGFMTVVLEETDLALRVVFVTADETESVIFKTGFG